MGAFPWLSGALFTYSPLPIQQTISASPANSAPWLFAATSPFETLLLCIPFSEGTCAAPEHLSAMPKKTKPPTQKTGQPGRGGKGPTSAHDEAAHNCLLHPSGGWAGLPVLQDVLDQLEDPRDLAACRSVCRAWRDEASRDHRWRKAWNAAVSDQGLWRWARAEGGYHEQLRARALVKKGKDGRIPYARRGFASLSFSPTRQPPPHPLLTPLLPSSLLPPPSVQATAWRPPLPSTAGTVPSRRSSCWTPPRSRAF